MSAVQFHPGAAWLVGGGEMGELVRSMDWSGTSLGPIDTWPESLRTAVGLALGAPVAAAVAWGPGHVLVYNDGYRAMCPAGHPLALGQSFRVCWAAEPAEAAVMNAFERALSGMAACLEDQRLVLDRPGRREEVRATFSFTPIRDESGQVGGVLHWITEAAQPEIARLRAAVEWERGHLLSVLEHMPLTASITRGPEHRLVFVNAMLRRQLGDRNVVGATMGELLREGGQASLAARDRVYATGEPVVQREVSRAITDGDGGRDSDMYFDVFYQPDRDPDGQVQGVISFGFEARSDGPGQGSEFVVGLPLAESPAAGSPGAQAREEMAENTDERPRVLVVDDNQHAADMLADALRALGYRVDVAYDGHSALGMAQEHAPSIAILDIGLPMIGYELARRLRGLLGSVLLIAITGYGLQRDRELSRQAGFDEHLVKPIDLDVLARKLEEHQRSRTR